MCDRCVRLSSSIWLTVASVATLWLGASCHLIGGTNGLEVDEAFFTAGGGGGGTGGTGSSSSSTSSTSGEAGSGGGECVAAECPGDDTDCAHRACVEGNCQLLNETPNTPCGPALLQFCDGAGNCVACTSNDHCPSGLCQDNGCVDASCNDNVQNNDETDIDCGGPCGSCVNGKLCLIDADCQSLVCDLNTCVACSSHSQCTTDRYCANGACVPDKDWAEACEEDEECKSPYHCKWVGWPVNDDVCGLI